MQNRGWRKCRRIAHCRRMHVLIELKNLMSLVCKCENSQEVVRWASFTEKIHSEDQQRFAKTGRHIPRVERPHGSSVIAICKDATLGIWRKNFCALLFRGKRQDRVRNSPVAQRREIANQQLGICNVAFMAIWSGTRICFMLTTLPQSIRPVKPVKLLRVSLLTAQLSSLRRV